MAFREIERFEGFEPIKVVQQVLRARGTGWLSYPSELSGGRADRLTTKGPQAAYDDRHQGSLVSEVDR